MQTITRIVIGHGGGEQSIEGSPEEGREEEAGWSGPRDDDEQKKSIQGAPEEGREKEAGWSGRRDDEQKKQQSKIADLSLMEKSSSSEDSKSGIRGFTGSMIGSGCG